MNVKTSVKAGALSANHNEAQVRELPTQKKPQPKAQGIKVKTSVKAGLEWANHSELQVRAAKKAAQLQAKGLKVKTSIKAGGLAQHNEVLVRGATQKKPKAQAKTKGLKVKTSVQAGYRFLNHNEVLARTGR